MITAALPYIKVEIPDNRHSSSSAYYSVYVDSASDDDSSTADLNDLWNDEAFIQSINQRKIEDESVARCNRVYKLYASFIQNGGETLGVVANKVFAKIAAEIVTLPFNEILVQYSPTNNLILFDLSFNKGIEVSIGKYLQVTGDENVVFSFSIDDEPYVVNMKNIHELKDVLLETLSR